MSSNVHSSDMDLTSSNTGANSSSLPTSSITDGSGGPRMAMLQTANTSISRSSPQSQTSQSFEVDSRNSTPRSMTGYGPTVATNRKSNTPLMSPRQITMGPRPSVPMLPLTAAENKPIPNDADIGSSWDVVTDAPNQTGATDFIGMDVEPQGSHGPLSLQNNDMTAMWSQINSIIGEAPNTILPNLCRRQFNSWRRIVCRQCTTTT